MVKVMTGLCNCMEEEGMADRLDSIGVRANLQERRSAIMRELPNDRYDFALKHGAPVDHTEKTGGIPYHRATNRASRVQTRKRNT